MTDNHVIIDSLPGDNPPQLVGYHTVFRAAHNFLIGRCACRSRLRPVRFSVQFSAFWAVSTMVKVWAIRLSLALNLLTVIAALAIWLNSSRVIHGFMEKNHDRRASFFEIFPVSSSDVVFLGDSITQGGEWAELFPNLSVKNRGIGGDTTSGLLERLHQVTDGQPSALYIKIGTNDLTHGPDQRDISYLQYREIIARVQEESPSTHIYLQSLLPRAADYKNQIEAFNSEIERLAKEMGVTYINLYTHFLDPDGSIADELSNDELHLNGQGYLLWQSLLEPYLVLED